MPARTIYLVKRLEAAIRQRLEAELRELDLTPSQYTTLSMLAARPDSSASDLARRVLVTPQSMSETIIALDRKGLVQRKGSRANRKVLGISLSDAGRALIEAAEARVDALEAELLSALGVQEIERLRASLVAMLRTDDQIRDPGRPGG